MAAPRFLLKKDFLFVTIVFVVAFSALFLAFYHPHSASFWMGLSNPIQTVNTLLYFLSAISVLALSKAVMYLLPRNNNLPLGRFYIIAVVAECIILSVLYVVFALFVVNPPAVFSFVLCLKAFLCVSIILGIPYTMCALYASNRDKEEELAAMKATALTSGIVSQYSEIEHEFVDFRDYNGALKLSVAVHYIYYIESQDNYVNICYEVDNRIENYLLRAKTTEVEKVLADTPIIRCHRSYMVNPQHIRRFMAMSGSRGKLAMDHDGISLEVPVSKTYYAAIEEIVSRESHR